MYVLVFARRALILQPVTVERAFKNKNVGWPLPLD